MSGTPRVESILRAMIDGVEYTDPPQSRLESLLLELKDTIETEGGGSGGGGVTPAEVKTIVATEIAKVIDDAPSSFDTLKEIADWIEDHPEDTAAMNTQIQQNTADISDLGMDKQDKTDNTLTTAAKNVDGAINELAGDVGDIQSTIPSTATPANPLLDTASAAITATATESPINGSANAMFRKLTVKGHSEQTESGIHSVGDAKWEKIVLDGSENWLLWNNNTTASGSKPFRYILSEETKYAKTRANGITDRLSFITGDPIYIASVDNAAVKRLT